MNFASRLFQSSIFKARARIFRFKALSRPFTPNDSIRVLGGIWQALVMKLVSFAMMPCSSTDAGRGLPPIYLTLLYGLGDGGEDLLTQLRRG